MRPINSTVCKRGHVSPGHTLFHVRLSKVAVVGQKWPVRSIRFASTNTNAFTVNTCTKVALRGFVWVDASANRVATACTCAPLCNRRLTERRTLGVSLSRKGALCADDATATWPRGAFWTGDVTERRILRVRLDQRARSACERWLRREAVFAGLCTLLHTHGRSRERAGPWVPRRRRPHGPRDARTLGPEVHATGAVTQPSTYTSSRSLTKVQI